jgi:hypothetical protein
MALFGTDSRTQEVGMKFRYGISPRGLARWMAFERVSAIQAERGPDVGRLVMEHIIDAELAAIERATAKDNRREVQELCSLVLSS